MVGEAQISTQGTNFIVADGMRLQEVKWHLQKKTTEAVKYWASY